MTIQISELILKDGRELWFIGHDGKPLPGLYLDRDHSMNVGRLLIADFDQQELDFESFDPLPSHNFPPGFIPFRRKNKSAGVDCVVVCGPGGLLPLYFESPEKALETSKELVAKFTSRLSVGHNTKSQSLAGPKSL